MHVVHNNMYMMIMGEDKLAAVHVKIKERRASTPVGIPLS